MILFTLLLVVAVFAWFMGFLAGCVYVEEHLVALAAERAAEQAEEGRDGD